MKAYSEKYHKKYFKYGYYNDYIQPALTSDGTLGGDNFAVSASTNGGVPDLGRGTAYGACFPQTGRYSSYTKHGKPSIWFTLYVPEPIILKKFEYSVGWGLASFDVTLEASNDNESWSVLNPTERVAYGFHIINLNNIETYRYYKLTVGSLGGENFDGINLSNIRLIGKKYGGYIEVGEDDNYDFTKNFLLLKLPKIENKYFAIKN